MSWNQQNLILFIVICGEKLCGKAISLNQHWFEPGYQHSCVHYNHDRYKLTYI